MGISRVLKERFRNLGDIAALNPDTTLVPESENIISKEKVESAVSQVAPAIKSLGGQVAIKRIDEKSNTVILQYKGPAKLITGLKIILKDVKNVNDVLVEEF